MINKNISDVSDIDMCYAKEGVGENTRRRTAEAAGRGHLTFSRKVLSGASPTFRLRPKRGEAWLSEATVFRPQGEESNGLGVGLRSAEIWSRERLPPVSGWVL